MRKLVALLILFISINLFSQRQKTVSIYKKASNNIDAIFTYDDNRQPKDTLIVWLAQDYRYSAIVELITIHNGNPKTFYNFLCQIVDFCNRETQDITDQINGQTVRWYKKYGVIGIDIYGEGKNLNGWSVYTPKQITKIKSAFEIWAKENNVIYQ